MKQYDLSKKWGIPRSECSCPNCGYEYGHHGTLVDPKTEFCSTCFKKQLDTEFDSPELISAEMFIYDLKKRI